MWRTFSILVILAGCSVGKRPPSQVKDANDIVMTPAEKTAWIAKAARVLRYGGGIESQEELEVLTPLSRDEIVDKLMADSRFGDTILDFNLYFLGFKQDNLRNSDDFGALTYSSNVYARQAAIHAARNLMTGGDYLSLFDLKQPNYATPAGPAFELSDNGDVLAGTSQEHRAHILPKIAAIYDAWLQRFKPSGSNVINRDDGCRGLGDDSSILSNLIFAAGLQPDIPLAIIARWNPRISIMCASAVPAEIIYAEVGAIKDRIAKGFALADQMATDAYLPQTLLDIKESGLEAQDPEWFGSAMTFAGFWDLLQNSSTNHNRRRGAYMLKTYFCDDLTPVAVVQPAVHAAQAHASDSSCRSCHYKLDPMAGFFRDRGFFGYDFRDKAAITFDDNATFMGEKLADYFSSWKFPEGSSRVWNVGYVRSTTELDANSYEPPDPSVDPLASLYKIIRTAPEAKQCLVRRMGEYFLGTGQVFDGAWMASLGDAFAADQSSSDGAKKVIKALVLSNTFRQRNPNATVCYDSPAGVSSTVPCEVRFVLETNCKSCHSNLFDLSDKDTLKEMQMRLASEDTEVRMPYNKDMADADRVSLVKWLEKRLDAANGGE